MKFRGTLLLLIISIILGTCYFLIIRPQVETKKKAEEFEKRFFRADSRDIVFIRMENRDGAVELSQGPQGWMIESQGRYRPDEGVLKKLLSTIASGRLTKVVGDGSELSQFGFDRAVLQLTLGLGTTRDVLVIGEKNPANTGYYAYSASLGKIFLVNEELPKALYHCLYDFREKRLYPFETDQVGTVVVQRGAEVIELVRGGDGWQMRSPLSTVASTEEVETFLRAICQQKAERFFPWERSMAELPKKARLTLLDRSGQSLATSELYYRGTGEHEGIVVHSPGSDEAAQVRRDLWEILHGDTLALLNRRLFSGEASRVLAVRIVTGSERIVLQRQGARWLKNGQTVSSADAERVLSMIMNWKGEKLIATKKSVANPHTTIEIDDGSTVQQLQVYSVDMTSEVSSPGALVDQSPQNMKLSPVVYWLASATTLSGQVLVGSHEIDRLLGQARQLK